MARPRGRLGVPALLGLTLGPALIVGAGLWLLAGMMPDCTIDIRQTVPAPEGGLALTVAGLDCGAEGTSTLAAIHAAGDGFSPEALTVFAAEGTHELAPRWLAVDQVEIALPRDAEILRRLEEAGGVAIGYR